jgi:PAS domain S-box-containing protein
MSRPDLDQKKLRQEQEERIQRQIAFASGLFQGDVTIRTLLESLAEGVVIIDNSGTILLVNTSAGQMFGYPEKELIGKPHAVIIPERFRKVLEEHEADYFKEPRIKPMAQLLDLAGRRRDGSEFPAEINLSFIETINGVLVLVLISDITMRKQFELRLRESEERFRATFNQAAVGIGHAGLDGRWLRLNQKYCDIVGYTEEEIKALTIKDITHPDDVETSMRHFQLLLEGKLGNYSLEKRFIRKDGSTVWVNLTASMVPDAGGNPIFAAVVIEDITARKRATEERERLLLQLEAVLESINEGVAISDLEGNVLTMNKEALAFHEFETIEQVRRQLSEYQELFELFDLEGRLVPVEQWPLPRALRGERFADWEVCVRRKDSGK